MHASGEQNERCETCRFWRAESSECHRHAPSVVHALSSTAGAWPVTAASEWCGEWAFAGNPPEPSEQTAPSESVATSLFLARIAPNLDARNPTVLLASLLDQLPSDVRQVFVRTNGLDGRPPAGLRDVAREFKMSQGHVRALITTGEGLLTNVVRLLSPKRERS